MAEPKDKKKKDIPYVKGISSSIASLPNYEGLINTPTANKFFELVKDKNYGFGAKGIGNWTSANGGKSTSVDSIDCSGTICTVKNAQGADYDLTNTNAAKFKSNAKVSGIDPKDSVDGDMIVFQTSGGGTDHIGFVVVDDKGRRYIAESSSSYNGTTITPFDDRIKDLESRHGKMTWDIISDTENRPKPKPYNVDYTHAGNESIEVRPAIKKLDVTIKESNKRGAIPQGSKEIDEPITKTPEWIKNMGESVFKNTDWHGNEDKTVSEIDPNIDATSKAGDDIDPSLDATSKAGADTDDSKVIDKTNPKEEVRKGASGKAGGIPQDLLDEVEKNPDIVNDKSFIERFRDSDFAKVSYDLITDPAGTISPDYKFPGDEEQSGNQKIPQWAKDMYKNVVGGKSMTDVASEGLKRLLELVLVEIKKLKKRG
jgi:hypothetical protein